MLTINGQLGLIVTLQEEHLAKKEAYAVVNYLQSKMGLKVAMITGDNKPTADKVAKYLGIDPKFVVSQAYPEDKKASVKKWQQ